MTTVHIHNTIQGPCKCGNWLQHWRNYSVLPMPLHCPATLCREKPEVGVLVQRTGAEPAGWCVLPLCRRHSQSKLDLEVSSFTVFVSADISQTCEQEQSHDCLAPQIGG
jgi:hypothetical protein